MKTAFKKRDSPTTKLQLSPVLKAPVITPKFPLQLPLRCFDISPFSAKVVLLLYTACRRFSLTKGPVAEKGRCSVLVTAVDICGERILHG